MGVGAGERSGTEIRSNLRKLPALGGAVAALVVAQACGTNSSSSISEHAPPRGATVQLPQGSSVNTLSTFHAVRDGNFKDINLQAVVESIEKEFEVTGCEKNYGLPGVPVYTDVDGVPRELFMFYRPGEKVLEGDALLDLPAGITTANGFYGFFDGERYDLPTVLLHHQEGPDMALILPESIQTPGPVHC